MKLTTSLLGDCFRSQLGPDPLWKIGSVNPFLKAVLKYYRDLGIELPSVSFEDNVPTYDGQEDEE